MEMGNVDRYKVFVRGKLCDLSPLIIYAYVECVPADVLRAVISPGVVIKKITGSSRRIWPKARVFSSSELSMKYYILHKIALKNWMPTSHRFGV